MSHPGCAATRTKPTRARHRARPAHAHAGASHAPRALLRTGLRCWVRLALIASLAWLARGGGRVPARQVVPCFGVGTGCPGTPPQPCRRQPTHPTTPAAPSPNCDARACSAPRPCARVASRSQNCNGLPNQAQPPLLAELLDDLRRQLPALTITGAVQAQDPQTACCWSTARCCRPAPSWPQGWCSKTWGAQWCCASRVRGSVGY